MADLRATGGSPWPAIALVVGAGVVSACQVGKATAALAAVQADLGLNIATASWLLSAFALVGAALGVALGVTVDRAGARRAAVAGLLVQGLAGAAGALAAGAPFLLLTRALEGVGFLAVTVAAPSLIVALAHPRDQGRAMALWGTFMPVGMTLALVAAPLLGAVGWRGFWLANAALLLAYAALLAAGLRALPAPTAPARRLTDDVRDTLTSRAPWLLAGLFAAFAAAWFALFGFLPQLLAERLGVAPGTAGLLTGFAVAASALGNLLCGFLLARGARRAPVLLGGFAAMGLCGFGALQDGVAGGAAYGLCLLFSAVGGLVPVALLDAGGSHAPRSDLVGATIGFMMQGNSAGLVLGPAAAGAVAASAGWPAVGWLVAALAASAALGVGGLQVSSGKGPARLASR